MKNPLYFLFAVLSLSFGACNETEEEAIVPQEVATESSERRTDAANARRIGDEFFQDQATTVGPLTVQSAPLVIVARGQRRLVPPGNGIATGVYFCDVYKAEGVVTLPANAFPMPATASPTGYDQSQSEIEGTSFEFIGTTVRYRTYSFVPRTDVQGRQIAAGPIPRDIRGVTFTYSYIQF